MVTPSMVPAVFPVHVARPWCPIQGFLRESLFAAMAHFCFGRGL